MAQAGKINNAIQEMERLEIKIMGISEMRWPGSNYCDINKHRVYYSGTSNGQHQYGVGVIVCKAVAESVTNFIPVSERIMLLQINAKPTQINIIQVYAPTTDHTDEEVEEFYSQIIDILEKLPKQDLNIVMGDFNSKIGKGREGDFIGPYGLGERNDRGNLLSIFAGEQGFAVMNTFFTLPPRRLYTWKHPKDSPENTIRNQIDYILVKKRYRNSCTCVKTYPSADIQSDHNPLVGTFRVKLKRIRKKIAKRYDLRKLKEPLIKSKAETRINDELRLVTNISNIEEEIVKIKDTVEIIKKELLKPDTIKKKTWMTNEILQMMEERRLVKRNPEEYKNINKIIKKKIREAKEKEAKEKCDEIEALQSRYDSFNVYRKINEITGKYKTRSVNKLVDNEGKIIVNKEEIKNTWKSYIEQLFYDDRPNPPQTNYETGPRILVEEVQNAIKNMKEGKASGPDNIQTEFLKLLDEDNVKWLTSLFNRIYDCGSIPKEWLKSEFIILPKKPGAKNCSEYRTISLMSHLLKLFLKIIHKRIYKLCEEQVSPTQFGFRNAVGTREALFSIQVLFQRCRDVNCDVYACFIDYQKAFDRVQHQKMTDTLRNIGLDDKDLRIIINLYWNQTASMKVEEENIENIKILRGVRQGCILSPLLFNIYSEYIFREALENTEIGIPLNGERLNNIRYADDTVIFADSLENLQILMNRVTESSQRQGLEINITKTKLMIISKSNIPRCHLMINQKPIEQVKKYTYLGTTVNDQWDHSQEIKIRIEKARAVFNKMSAIFKSHDLTITSKIRFLRCYVFSVLLYGAESWTLTNTTEKRLEAFELWLYRRILRVSWIERITNDEILQRMEKDREILTTIKTRKLQYLGHIMRNESRFQLLQVIIQGKVQGKRGVGRRRISWLKNLRTWFSKTTTQLFRAAVNKVIIAKMVADIRNG